MSNIIPPTPSRKHTLEKKVRAWKEDCVEPTGWQNSATEEDESEASMWVHGPKKTGSC